MFDHRYSEHIRGMNNNNNSQYMSNPNLHSKYTSLHLNSSMNGKYDQPINKGYLTPLKPQALENFHQEKLYDSLNIQEGDLLLEMSRLHPSSYSFQNKKDLYLKMRDLKGDLEKQMIYSQVNKSLNNLSLMSYPPIIPSRGGDITQTLNYGYGEQPKYQVLREQYNGDEYDPINGFVLRIDYVSFIPSYFFQVFMNFGIFQKGQAFLPYFKTDAHISDKESTLLAKCMINERRHIQDIKSHVDTVIYLEMHSNEQDPNKMQPLLRGWTMHELFDKNGNLSVGRFKLPFYSRKLDPHDLEKRGLPIIKESSLFIRICCPNDPALDNETLIFKEKEYNFPLFHQRNENLLNQQLNLMSSKGYEKQKKQEEDQTTQNTIELHTQLKIEQQKEQEKKRRQKEQGEIRQKQKQQEEVEVEKENEKKEEEEQKEKEEKQKEKEEEEQNQKEKERLTYESRKNIRSTQSNTSILYPGKNNVVNEGLTIKLIGLENILQEESKVKITVKLIEKMNTISERGNKDGCEHTFQVDLNKGKNYLQLQRNFNVSVGEMLKKSKETLSNMYLQITIISKKGQLGWIYQPLFVTKTTQLNSGKFKDLLLKPPVTKPPFNPKTSKVPQQIEYIIQNYGQDITEIKEFDFTQNKNDKSMMGSKKLLPQPLHEPIPQLKIDLIKILDYKSENFLSIDVAIICNKKVITDDSDNPLVFNCSDLIGPDPQKKFEVKINLVAQLQIDVFQVIQKKPQDWENYSVFIKIIQADENGHEATMGWLIHPLFINGQPNFGKFEEVFFKTPIQANTPVDFSKIQCRKERLEFEISQLKINQPHQEHQPSQMDKDETPKSLVSSVSLRTITLPQAYKSSRSRFYEDHQSQNKQGNTSLDGSFENSVASSKPEEHKIFKVVLLELIGQKKITEQLYARLTILKNESFLTDDLGEEVTFEGSMNKMNSKNVVINEDYLIDVNINKLGQELERQSQQEKKDLHGSIQLLVLFLNEKHKVQYWYFLQLLDPQYKPIIGIIESQMYAPPLIKISEINQKKLKQVPVSIKIQIEILDKNSAQ